MNAFDALKQSYLRVVHFKRHAIENGYIMPESYHEILTDKGSFKNLLTDDGRKICAIINKVESFAYITDNCEYLTFMVRGVDEYLKTNLILSDNAQRTVISSSIMDWAYTVMSQYVCFNNSNPITKEPS